MILLLKVTIWSLSAKITNYACQRWTRGCSATGTAAVTCHAKLCNSNAIAKNSRLYIPRRPELVKFSKISILVKKNAPMVIKNVECPMNIKCIFYNIAEKRIICCFWCMYIEGVVLMVGIKDFLRKCSARVRKRSEFEIWAHKNPRLPNIAESDWQIDPARFV